MSYIDRYENETPSPAGTETVSTGVTWTGMSQTRFATAVLPYFGIAVFLTACGTGVGKGLGPGFVLPAVILNLALYFVLMWKRHVPGVNVALLYGYAFMNGLMIGPAVAMAGAAFPGIVAQAFVLAALSFFSVAGFVLITGKDFSGLQAFLVAGLFVIILGGIVNVFVGGAGLGLGLAILSVITFLGFTAYDMSNIMHKFRDDEYILATVELYLDFLNLFLAFLRILIHIAASQRR